jgi:hypothetical protein
MGDILSQAPWSFRKELVAATLLAVFRGREPVFAQAAISRWQGSLDQSIALPVCTVTRRELPRDRLEVLFYRIGTLRKWHRLSKRRRVEMTLTDDLPSSSEHRFFSIP